jgi:2-keto-3-deoxy-L-rhamnonate aldolase RhmA
LVAASAWLLAGPARRGKAAGCVVANPEQDRQWVAKGFRMVVYSGDIWLLGGALAAGFERLWA